MNFEALLAALKTDEGSNIVAGAHQPYRCPAGKWSVGWGHNLEAHGIPGDLVAPLLSGKGISDEQAEQLLYADATQAQRDAASLLPNWLLIDSVRQNVVSNMAFNMGRSVLSTFHLFLSALDKRNYNEATFQMKDSKWYTQTGHRSKRLAQEMLTGAV
jgi:lysozyme